MGQYLGSEKVGNCLFLPPGKCTISIKSNVLTGNYQVPYAQNSANMEINLIKFIQMFVNNLPFCKKLIFYRKNPLGMKPWFLFTVRIWKFENRKFLTGDLFVKFGINFVTQNKLWVMTLLYNFFVWHWPFDRHI